ncbi:MAG TPA: hypothetical protein VNI58_03970, partial [Mariprofundaceae bacterium]|nr:hypothetical protein [Mariprofundaceae bacterium]
MADEPSIDEILASLDKLLKESDSGNDEPAPTARRKPAAVDDSLEALESSLAEVLGTQPKRPAAKKPAPPPVKAATP